MWFGDNGTQPHPDNTEKVPRDLFQQALPSETRWIAPVVRYSNGTERSRQGGGGTRETGVEMSIKIEVDGVTVTTEEGRNLVDVAAESGTYIPTLCYLEGEPALGTCRACVVKVNGRVTPACTVKVTDGMRIEAKNRRRPICAKRWSKYCSPKATTTVPVVRRAV